MQKMLSEEERIALIELELMKRYELTYTELQSIPLKTILIWESLREKIEEKQKFELMKNKQWQHQQ